MSTYVEILYAIFTKTPASFNPVFAPRFLEFPSGKASCLHPGKIMSDLSCVVLIAALMFGAVLLVAACRKLEPRK